VIGGVYKKNRIAQKERQNNKDGSDDQIGPSCACSETVTGGQAAGTAAHGNAAQEGTHQIGRGHADAQRPVCHSVSILGKYRIDGSALAMTAFPRVMGI